MKRSLQRHLSFMLGGAIVLTGMLAAIASFMLAYSEAKEFQDDMLRQIAALAGSNNTRSGLSRMTANVSPDTPISDPESRILIVHLPEEMRPDWLVTNLSPGFHTLDSPTDQLRLYVRGLPTGKQIIVAQPTDARNELAINSALRTLVPLLLLIPALVGLIARIVRSELTPITRIALNLDKQPADRPHPILGEDLPAEITPFVLAINRLLVRVNDLMSQQRRFIADAAHALRSPLTALSVQAQNLGQADSLERMRERVIPLRSGIERAQALTEQLLSLARTQAVDDKDAITNVSALARELIAEYLPLARRKHIDLGLEENCPVSLAVPAETLQLVIRNGLENALTYTPTDGMVTLRLQHIGNKVIIEIVDNGPGIPESERDRVFDSFYRISGTTEQGSGLGLTIAREATYRLGGTLSLHDPDEGSGLVFRYTHDS